MKNNYLLQFCLFFLVVGFQSHAQGIYLYMEDVTTGSGLASPHDNEIKLTSAQMDVSKEGSAAPAFSEYSLTKDLDMSSASLMTHVVTGAIPKFVEIRYYNSTNEIVSRVELQNALVTKYSASSADCGGSCPTLSESFSISFGGIQVVHQSNLKDPTFFNYNYTP
ncbi:type VI secretion system (T6SS) effector Hcp [Dyadobacter jejuensis]|uniref:Type VI secretion system (T6SS) effector Hcp n=1 Tax=Dyadobacter jejuensis TaxID=1082580 RepID=A0A316ACS8_9BACT|nr:type VI secretion system tube protein Hcp [Dyadobacter jejuensis]PWJ54780.1 type VI secretion system (T6SS) effector Hcp [Dyadobacter jejuensis]